MALSVTGKPGLLYKPQAQRAIPKPIVHRGFGRLPAKGQEFSGTADQVKAGQVNPFTPAADVSSTSTEPRGTVPVVRQPPAEPARKSFLAPHITGDFGHSIHTTEKSLHKTPSMPGGKVAFFFGYKDALTKLGVYKCIA